MKSAEEIVNANLKYFGHDRLRNMEKVRFNQIVKLMNVVPGEDREATVEQLLAAKKEREGKERSKSPLGRDAAAEAIQTAARQKARTSRSSSSPGATPVTTPVTTPTLKPVATPAKRLPQLKPWELFDAPDTPGVPMPVTLKKTGPHQLKVAAFNSYKLRVGKAGLDSQWVNLIKTFAVTCDIIMISEAPAEEHKNSKDRRGFTFQNLLNAYSPEAPFSTFLISTPSGPGNLESHHVYVKSHLEVLDFKDQPVAGKTTLDHAPFSLHVYDERFENEDNRNWIFTSVHFPPKTRARERDVQLHAFLHEYNTSSEFRLNQPMTAKGARDAKTCLVNHVVAGDFNVYPDRDIYKLASRGFDAPLLGEHVSTSAGCQAYDNFLVSTDTAKRFTINRQVLELEMMKKHGQDGISDHNPIIASFTESRLVKKCHI